MEQWFGLKIQDTWWHGIKDVQVTLPGAVPLVIDHKTTKDPSRYAMSPEELATNVQACLYATEAMARTGASACDVRWVYYSTKANRPAKVVEARLSRETVEPILEQAVQVARHLKVIRESGVRALEVPCNPGACDAFGGCDYKEMCGEFTPLERMFSKMASPEEVKAWLSSIKRPAINPPDTVTAPPVAQRPAMLPPPGPVAEVKPPPAPVHNLPTLPSPSAEPPLAPPPTVAKRGRKPAPSPSAEMETIAATPAAILEGKIPRHAVAEFLVTLGGALINLGENLKLSVR